MGKKIEENLLEFVSDMMDEREFLICLKY